MGCSPARWRIIAAPITAAVVTSLPFTVSEFSGRLDEPEPPM